METHPASCGALDGGYGTAFTCRLPKGHPGKHSMFTYEQMPRRCRVDHRIPAETAISDAVKVIEAIPFQEGRDHTLLTDAVVLLGQAREKVADFVDGVARRQPELRKDDSVVVQLAISRCREVARRARANELAPSPLGYELDANAIDIVLGALESLGKEPR
jgi:hypothetical protein